MSRAALATYDRIDDLLDGDSTQVDMAVRFVEQLETSAGIVDGRVSPVYGGRYDAIVGDITGPAAEENVVTYRLLPDQYDIATADNDITEHSGGRGAGKSMSAVAWSTRLICEHPRTDGLAHAATARGTRTLFKKLLAAVPPRWLLPGTAGMVRQDGQQHLGFRNGVGVDFFSIRSNNRGPGYQWIVFDEAGFMSDDQVLDAHYCLRDSTCPRELLTLTPSALAWQRHAKAVADPLTLVRCSPSKSNFLACRAVYTRTPCYDVKDGVPDALDPQGYDVQRWAVEVDVDWTVIEKWMALERRPVLYGLDRKVHCVSRPPSAMDVTRHILQRLHPGRPWRFVLGFDWGKHENTMVAYRLFGTSNRTTARTAKWLAVDCLCVPGPPDALIAAMNRSGYSPQNSFCIPDASGSWQHPGEPRACHDLLKDAGFFVWAPSTNPPVDDRHNAFKLLVSPAVGEPRWFALMPKCEFLVSMLERCVLKQNGKVDKSWVQIGERKLDPTAGLDAASYPIHRLCPASPRAQQSGVRGFTASRL